jgi:transposase
LIEASLQPGVSVAGLALRYGINANLLRTWIRKHQEPREAGGHPAVAAPLPAFIPVLPTKPLARAELPGLAVQLPNGVKLEFAQVEAEGLATLLQQLHALPCSGSMRG